MFFSAYLGGATGFLPWRQAVVRHATWLGLSSRFERRDLPDSAILGLAWLALEPRLAGRSFVEHGRAMTVRTYGDITAPESTPDGVGAWRKLATQPDGNTIWATASLDHAELSFVVPPTTPQQLFVAHTKAGWIFADDLRLFVHLGNSTLDRDAVYALFQYSTIPATLTLFANVHRVPNGHRVQVRAGSDAPVWTPILQSAELSQVPLVEREAEQRIAETLDAILATLPKQAVLYFSGGVDSGLMAARLAGLGRRDVRLVNYAFAASDEEHQGAIRMAKHLGFRCELIPQADDQGASVFSRAARDYSFPFGDISTIPMNHLVHGSLPFAAEAGTVVEGTGADGAYGMAAAYPRWRRTYRVPWSIRELVSTAYAWWGLWRFDNRFERMARFARKSAALPLPHAVIAQNALHRIAFGAPPQGPGEFALIASRHLDAVAGGLPALDHLSLLDLMWVCAGRMAPKSFDPLRAHGIRTIYPFLEPSMVSLSSSLDWRTKCTGGQAKAILKRMLAREIPPDWVYRRKTGFTRVASARAFFAMAPVQAILHDVALSPQNPLREFCNVPVVRRMVDRARRHSLSVGAHIFLWTFAFTSAWVRGCFEARGNEAR
jgi:asparagine synthetase B (glutamine-hydrolysing)